MDQSRGWLKLVSYSGIPLPAERDRVIISVNPKAGSGSGNSMVARLTEFLTERKLRVEIVRDLAELRDLAAACANSIRAVVAAGGDGTVALLANRLPENIPLAILPAGTENLLSKFLGIRPTASAVGSMIVDGQSTRLDVGCVADRLFLLMAGCGFDAEVVRRLDETRTGNIGHVSYIKPILASLRHYSYPPLRVYCDGHDAIEAKWVFVVNVPRYAAGLYCVPQAISNDGLLDVCTFREGSFFSGLRYLAGVVTGQHQKLDSCTIMRTPAVRIESDASVPYQLDGDPGGELPLSISVRREHLWILAPQAWITAHCLPGGGSLVRNHLASPNR